MTGLPLGTAPTLGPRLLPTDYSPTLLPAGKAPVLRPLHHHIPVGPCNHMASSSCQPQPPSLALAAPRNTDTACTDWTVGGFWHRHHLNRLYEVRLQNKDITHTNHMKNNPQRQGLHLFRLDDKPPLEAQVPPAPIEGRAISELKVSPAPNGGRDA